MRIIILTNDTVLNSNLIKIANISTTISANASNNSITGYGGRKGYTEFSGYPSDVTKIIGFLQKTCYNGSNWAYSISINDTCFVMTKGAGTYNISGYLLYV